MADEISDDELDGILDGALEAFESVPKPKAASVPSEQATDLSSAALQKSDDGSSKNSDDAPPGPELNAEAARAFDDALKALGDLGVNPPEGGDEDVNEADMKLVEEFMASLGSSLGGLGVPGAPGDASREAPGRGGGGAGGGSLPPAESIAPHMEKLVESIVGHLVSEDVLKSPMLQMRDAYAEWLPKHAEKLSEEELGRYSKQQELVEQICERYESGADSGMIMELLSKMQETGSPPADVMKFLSSDGENGDKAGLPGMAPPELDKMVESCRMQ